MRIKIVAAAIITATILGSTASSSYFTVLAQTSGPSQQVPSASSESRSVWDGVYTEEQAKVGEALYQRECASCHGDTLKGTGEASPLAGIVFLSNWNGLLLGDLFDRIHRSMPKNKPRRLSRQQTADTLAYILSVNQFPAGKTELPRQTEMLREIRFEATKPDPKGK
jgi:S-disulfanyl-L-cysteine oxidoreductase SoxD